MEVSMDTVDEDRISNLPSSVIDLILSFLPTKEVLRTSILSTKWRYQWTTVPTLVFMEDFSDQTMKNLQSTALASIINHVLSLHRGSIEVLRILNLCGISNLDHWVISVSRKGIKVFTLMLCATSYTLHSSLYNCQSLVTLQLWGCSIRPPSYFTGLKSLKSLYLQDVTLFNGVLYENDDAFENMISSCPMLESLTLINVRGIGNLPINAQNLRYLEIRGFHCNITLGCTLPKLVSLLVDQNMVDDGVHGSAYKQNSLTEFFINIPRIHKLTLRGTFMRYLTTVGVIPERLPFLLNDLRRLKIVFHIDEQRQNSAALCLFKSSPHLRDIVIAIQASAGSGANTSNIWKCSGKSRCIFEKLQFVTIWGVRQRTVDFALVEFMLAESPVLKKMRIAESSGKESVLQKSMLKFKRASTKAKIVFI